MTITQMKYFISVVKHKSISKAAKENFVSVTAISLLLTELESNYKIKFFKKEGNTFLLTEDGKVIYEKLLKIIEDYIEFENTIIHLQTKKHTINIGISYYLNHYTFQNFLSDLIKKFPHIEFNVYEMHSSTICEKIQEKNIDIAFYFDIKDINSYEESTNFLLLKEDEIGCLVKRSHFSSNKKQIKFEDMLELPLLFLKKKTERIGKFKKGFSSIEKKLKPKYYPTQLNLLAELATNGGGALFLKNFSPQDDQFSFLEIEPKLIGQIKLNFIENNKAIQPVVNYIKENFKLQF